VHYEEEEQALVGFDFENNVRSSLRNTNSSHLPEHYPTTSVAASSSTMIEAPTQYDYDSTKDQHQHQQGHQTNKLEVSQQCEPGLTQSLSYPLERITRTQQMFVRTASPSNTSAWFRNSSSTVLENGTLATIAECYV
jgi:hypothetical protein